MDFLYFKDCKIGQIYFHTPLADDILVYCSHGEGSSPRLVQQVPRSTRFATFAVPDVPTFQLTVSAASTDTPLIIRTFSASAGSSTSVPNAIHSTDWRADYPSIVRHAIGSDKPFDRINGNIREVIVTRRAGDHQLASQVEVRERSNCRIEVEFRVLPGLLKMRFTAVNAGCVLPQAFVARRKVCIDNKVLFYEVPWETNPEVAIEKPLPKDQIAILTPANVSVVRYLDGEDGRERVPLHEAIVECQHKRVAGLTGDPLSWPEVAAKGIDRARYDADDVPSADRETLSRSGVPISPPALELCRTRPELLKLLASLGVLEALKNPVLLQLLTNTPSPVLRTFLHTFTSSSEGTSLSTRTAKEMLPALREYLDRPELAESLLNFPQMEQALRRCSLTAAREPVTPVAVIMGFKDGPQRIKKWLCRQPADELRLWLKLVAIDVPIEVLAKLRMELKIAIPNENPAAVIEALPLIEWLLGEEVSPKEWYIPGSPLFEAASAVEQRIGRFQEGRRTAAQLLEISRDLVDIVAATAREIDLLKEHRPPDPAWSGLYTIAAQMRGCAPLEALQLMNRLAAEYGSCPCEPPCSGGEHPPQIAVDGLLLRDFTAKRREREQVLIGAAVRLWSLCAPDLPPIVHREDTGIAKVMTDLKEKIDWLIDEFSGVQSAEIRSAFPGFDPESALAVVSAGVAECRAAAERSPDIAEAADLARVIAKINSALDTIAVSCSLEPLQELVADVLDAARGEDQTTCHDKVEMSRLREEIRSLACDLRGNLPRIISSITSLRELHAQSIERTKRWRVLIQHCDEWLLWKLGLVASAGIDEVRNAVAAHGKEVAAELRREAHDLSSEVARLSLIGGDAVDHAAIAELQDALRNMTAEQPKERNEAPEGNLVYPAEYRKLSALLAIQATHDTLRAKVDLVRDSLHRRLAETRDSIAKYKVACDCVILQETLQEWYENKDLSALAHLAERISLIDQIWATRTKNFYNNHLARLFWIMKGDDELKIRDTLLEALIDSRMERLLELDADGLREVLARFKKLLEAVGQKYGSIGEFVRDLRDELLQRFGTFLSAELGDPRSETAIPPQLKAPTPNAMEIEERLFCYLKNAGFEENELGWPRRPAEFAVHDPVVTLLLKHHLVPEV